MSQGDPPTDSMVTQSAVVPSTSSNGVARDPRLLRPLTDSGEHRLTARELLRSMRPAKATGVLLGLVAVSTFLSIQQPDFLTWSNWENILRSQAVVFALSIGMTLVLLTGGIDLSVGSMAAAAGMIIGLLMQHGASAEVGIAGGLGMGLAMGFLNGFAIGVLRIPFFVVTLGTLSIFQSIALLVTQGSTISLFGMPQFHLIDRLANGSTGPFPTVAVLLVVGFAVMAFVLHLTPFGRSIYAVGSNPEAARLSGINRTQVLIVVYALSGLFAGLGAVIQTGRITAAGPQADPNLMLTVIAAVLIGGTAFTGGEGGLLGTIIGVLFLGVIQNGLALSSVSTFWQGTVSGGILITAVGLGVLRTHGWHKWLLRRGATKSETDNESQ